MTGWNMPPGCNVSDIPGNTPADRAAEAQSEMIFERLNDIPAFAALSETDQMAIEEVVSTLMSEANQSGYQNGLADEAMAAEHRKSEQRNADRIDGYDRDDLGESPDY